MKLIDRQINDLRLTAQTTIEVRMTRFSRNGEMPAEGYKMEPTDKALKAQYGTIKIAHPTGSRVGWIPFIDPFAPALRGSSADGPRVVVLKTPFKASRTAQQVFALAVAQTWERTAKWLEAKDEEVEGLNRAYARVLAKAAELGITDKSEASQVRMNARFTNAKIPMTEQSLLWKAVRLWGSDEAPL
jgi:hypothetical protein